MATAGFPMARRTVQFGLALAVLSILQPAVASPLKTHTTLLTFEELTATDPEQDPVPITQYESLGVKFEYASVWEGGASAAVSGTKYISDVCFCSAPGLSIYFTGRLPIKVSFYLTSGSLGGAIDVSAWGPNGYHAARQTPGISYFEPDGVAIPQQFISFDSSSGIGALRLDNYFSNRGQINIDNLAFTSPVPEPNSSVLIGIGLAAVWVAARRRPSATSD